VVAHIIKDNENEFLWQSQHSQKDPREMRPWWICVWIEYRVHSAAFTAQRQHPTQGIINDKKKQSADPTPGRAREAVRYLTE